jgi:hypothetical protein
MNNGSIEGYFACRKRKKLAENLKPVDYFYEHHNVMTGKAKIYIKKPLSIKVSEGNTNKKNTHHHLIKVFQVMKKKIMKIPRVKVIPRTYNQQKNGPLRGNQKKLLKTRVVKPLTDLTHFQ